MLRRAVLLLTCCTLALGLGVLSPTAARASTSCVNPHCYSIIERYFSPGATEVWINLNTHCMTWDGTLTEGFDNNEIWAGAPGTDNYVEFGHTYHHMPGLPNAHWFWARTNNGNQDGFDLNRGYVNGTTYNATILYTGKSGNWNFIAGRTTYGSSAGDYPIGPVNHVQAGGEMYTQGVSVQIDSFADNSGGRIQTNTRYNNWSGPTTYTNSPPFASSYSHGDAYITNHAPVANKGAVC